MKPYTVSVDIDLPRDRVIELFDNPDNMFRWQDGLQSFDHVSGEPGQPGAISTLTYLNGKHKLVLTEEISERNLPDEFNGTYSWAGGQNTLVNRFIELGPDKTRWESTCEYSFRNIPLRLMALLAPGVFRKQNQRFLDNFKAFCEDGFDVRATKETTPS